MNGKFKAIVADCLCISGAALVIYGAATIYAPAGWIAGGVAVIWCAYAILRDTDAT